MGLATWFAPKVYVLVGLPASGKSTFASRFSYVLEREQIPSPVKFESAFGEYLSQRKTPILIDGVHPTVKSRANVIAMATRAGYVPMAIWFRAPLKTCIVRNAKRDVQAEVKGSLGRSVPLVAMMKFSKDFEPPTREEGFAKVIEKI